MSLTYPCRANDHQVGGDFKPVGLHERHDFVSGDLRIKFPVKVTQEFCSLDAGHLQEVFNPTDFLFFVFPHQKVMKECFFILRDRFQIGQEAKGFPQIR